MGTTTNYQIPYPAGSDPPAGAPQMQSLAERVDVVLKTNADADTALTTRVTNVENRATTLETKTAATAWTAIAFSTGWSQNAGSPLAQYRKVGDIVYLRGQITGTSAANSTIGFLPSGFRPNTPGGSGPIFVCWVYNLATAPSGARVDVWPTGEIHLQGGLGSAAVPIMALDNMFFSTL